MLSFDEIFNLSTLIIVLFVTLSSYSHMNCHLSVIIVIYFMNIWTFTEIKTKQNKLCCVDNF